MSINTAHAMGGVAIFYGERILVFTDGVEFAVDPCTPNSLLKGTKKGRAYLTSHRVIFNNESKNDQLQSFSIPFTNMRQVELEQPIFGANYIKGKVFAEPAGKWTGMATFKMWFTHGGAIEFGKAMLEAGRRASRHRQSQPPAYTPPTGPYYQAPPPAYAPAYNDPEYNWVPYQTFPSPPPSNSVYMTDAPPPYPGINGCPPPYPNQQGATAPPYPPQNGGYPPQQYGGFSQQNGGSPQNGNFNSPTDAKAYEAAQSAYYTPEQPHNVYVPQDAPPPYSEVGKKNN